MLELLETPVLLLDLDRLDSNIRRMGYKLAPFNVTLRPHVKTHKFLEVTGRLFAFFASRSGSRRSVGY